MANERKPGGSPAPIPGTVASNVPGLRWPGLPPSGALAVLALHEQLSHSQWWAPARVAALQLHQLAALIDHAVRTVPYYRRVLPRGGRIDAAFLRSLPLLTRAAVQEDPAALRSNSVPSAHGAAGEVRSSGSTGRPVELRCTGLTMAFRKALYLRDHFWSRRDLTLEAATIRNFKDGSGMAPQGKTVAGWGHGYATRPMHALNIRATVDQQLAWLQRVRPAYLATFPTNLRALAEAALARGVTLPGLRQASTYAESLPTGLRDLVRRAFGATVADIYSSEETGPIAFQCPDHEHYHLQAEHLMVEVLDENGRACAPGATGKVVVTDLHNFATPLIRYEVGDHAEVGPPCPCGRGLPVITRILGRTRHMLRLAGGATRWPSLPSGDELGAIAPVRQFQLVQKSLAVLELRLVVARPLSPAEEAKVRQAFLGDLAQAFELRLAYADAIPRAASGKYEDFRCEVTE